MKNGFLKHSLMEEDFIIFVGDKTLHKIVNLANFCGVNNYKGETDDSYIFNITSRKAKKLQKTYSWVTSVETYKDDVVEYEEISNHPIPSETKYIRPTYNRNRNPCPKY